MALGSRPSLAAMTVAATMAACAPPPELPKSAFFSYEELRQCFADVAVDPSVDAGHEAEPKYIPVTVYRVNSPGDEDPLDDIFVQKSFVDASQYFQKKGKANLHFQVTGIKDIEMPDHVWITDLVANTSQEVVDTFDRASQGDVGIRVFMINDKGKVFETPQHKLADGTEVGGFFDPHTGIVVVSVPFKTPFVLPHELGHFAGLQHPFENSSFCPEGVTGDCIEDVPFDPKKGGLLDDPNCFLNPDSCAFECDGQQVPEVTETVMNVMSYHAVPIECDKHFSDDQLKVVDCMTDVIAVDLPMSSQPLEVGLNALQEVQFPCNLSVEMWKKAFADALKRGPNLAITVCGHNVADRIRLKPGVDAFADFHITIQGTPGSTLVMPAVDVESTGFPAEMRFRDIVMEMPGSGFTFEGPVSLDLRNVTFSSDSYLSSLFQVIGEARVALENVVVEDGVSFLSFASMLRGGELTGQDVSLGKQAKMVDLNVFAGNDGRVSRVDLERLDVQSPLRIIVGGDDLLAPPLQETLQSGSYDVKCDSAGAGECDVQKTQ